MQILQAFAIRSGYAVILLIAVLVLNFSMMHLAPGDVADTISQSMGGADQELLDKIRADRFAVVRNRRDRCEGDGLDVVLADDLLSGAYETIVGDLYRSVFSIFTNHVLGHVCLFPLKRFLDDSS